MAQITSPDPGGDERVPRRAVVVLLDSLNRHMLGSYGAAEFDTPNLDRFATRALRFDRHFAGSLPCMPARHDLLCGSLDFLWKPWGSIELWEEPITVPLRRAGVVTKLVTDHPHLFEHGGENYHCDFTAWDYQRGHEGDPWRTRADPSWTGAPSFGRGWTPYDTSRGWFREEADFPGPRTMTAAARWLDEEAAAHEQFLLLIDEFDPHEPFDTPEPWASRYDPSWDGPHLIWPPYTDGAKRKGLLDDDQARQVRAQYGAKLSMIDAWFGHVLDALDRGSFWDDTMVVVCTDHGHFLGEKDIWGKPSVPIYEPLGHIPLLIAWPGRPAGSCDSLTTSVDLHATLAEVFGVTSSHRTHGRSLVPLLRDAAPRAHTPSAIHDHALAGIWGREVHVVSADGRKYVRGPAGPNEPLSMWSNRWSTMPLVSAHDIRLPRPDDRAELARMPGSDVPVIRQPFAASDDLPFWAWGASAQNRLFDLGEDPTEDHDLAGSHEEATMTELLRSALVDIEAPGDQLERLGLT